MRTYSKDIKKEEGKEVILKGWVNSRRDHGKLIFIDLRDKEGLVQIVFSPEHAEALKKADTLRPEWVVEIKGVSVKRPEKLINTEMPSGTHEIQATSLEIYAESKTPPFDVTTDGKEIGEEHRMKYRYLDLRRPRMQENLRMRANIEKLIRDTFTEDGFFEVETPYISKSTPEGARDYLVPARLHPGKFYALPQSPQQYKQLLMVAGFEKYFQIVRCFRDEDTRGDRQPEFTQLDVEISFTDQEEILALIQKTCLTVAKTLYPEKHISTLDENGNVPRMTYKEATKTYNTDRPDIRKDKNDPNELAFVFVVDFPVFEWKESEKRWDAVHHPFTMPQVKDIEDFEKQFKKDPSAMLAFQYDIVLNGYEIAGGSIRIHDPNLLSRVFEVMGNKKEDIKDKFGHILEAFEYGVPPHGGFAMGLDRFVAILQNESTIREVFAFPKTGDGRDLLMNSPSDVSDTQLKELHIKTNK
ncbi:hypothetical protein A3A21_01625 [Candidatus Jorgensenbacteria bacterium RIFCSPLOWO2_01_FULL_45_25b]|uniref:Aspartate--tRNA(Asp/Asn) ligase n=1 Tax=Candidatus Jorgensenbacteria bacterium RIFCSPLOWO2_01_FULL_45_25b TaxID=1798471 RepID=A0A1F6BTL3_9BACT|nr:MAG: hypothetical protein A3A21_01625 [Candidatus Jorgensenbacteria bacterium RIFCSPLOWO2_01_FULL_45_25b]